MPHLSDLLQDFPEPALKAFVVLDLKRKAPSVAFKKGEELHADWGNWSQIANVLLPSQACISIAADKELECVKELAAQNYGLKPELLNDAIKEGHAGAETAQVQFNLKEKLYRNTHNTDVMALCTRH